MTLNALKRESLALINELDRMEQPFILSLVYCHHIQEESVLELLAWLKKENVFLISLGPEDRWFQNDLNIVLKVLGSS